MSQETPEAKTRREKITPAPEATGWEEAAPHSYTEEETISDGRIIPLGKRARRRHGLRADYVLRYQRDFKIAVVEAKAEGIPAGNGVQQAKEYAEMLGVKFAYATNGLEIIEVDFITGREQQVSRFPTPAELWGRLRGDLNLNDKAAETLLTPYDLTAGKRPRYYQEIAINRAVEKIGQGQKRRLLTMATGTGKTFVAYQVCFKLWQSRWNLAGAYRRPKILYLSDRNILVDDPKDKMFAGFGLTRHKIEGSEISKGRDIYFAIYQAMINVYQNYSPDFFDLIIVDECHRGSARDDSLWREILAYFQPACQLGMTATPLRADTVDTYRYFGNPIYTYSLRQGIEDGFLAPYRVQRIITEYDAFGWRPTPGQLDRYGREIPDEEYQTKDFHRAVFLKAHTRAVARHITGFLRQTDRLAKTIVFCVDQEHADEMRRHSTEEIHTLSHFYETMLREMRDAAGDSGEFYTPRPVVQFMVQVTNPRLGEVVYDPAAGTGGFLVEAFKHLEQQVKTVEDRRLLHNGSIVGGEAKPLPYLLAQMNLLLHGLEAPQIDPQNSLRHKLSELGDRERVDVILTNPPFGGEEEQGIINNFPGDKKTAETALLFLQLIMRKLRRPQASRDLTGLKNLSGLPGGRAGVVVPNGTLFADGVAARIKEELLKEFNLHTIVRLPNGVFAPYTGIPTNLLFFERTGPTGEIWYYEIPLPEGRNSYTKTKPMQSEDFAGCLAWWDNRQENEHAWRAPVTDILKYDEQGQLLSANLDVKNPNAAGDMEHLPPEQLVADILDKEQQIVSLMAEIKQLLEQAS